MQSDSRDWQEKCLREQRAHSDTLAELERARAENARLKAELAGYTKRAEIRQMPDPFWGRRPADDP